MSELLHDLITNSAEKSPASEAIIHKANSLTYAELYRDITEIACGLIDAGLSRQERVAVYLPKHPETVISFFATSMAGGVFVPVNPLLKAEQVAHILKDCNARFLVTTNDRAELLKDVLPACHDLHTIIVLGDSVSPTLDIHTDNIISWASLQSQTNSEHEYRPIDTDMAAILYTSGSTGKPKGVVLSHRNMVLGAKSVSQYLENHSEDRLLAVLPFSFDYGFSQLSTSFHVGASVVLMDYLLPRDVVKAVAKHRITGLAAVPPLWVQLAQIPWSDEAMESLRYITNSGGAMPKATLDALRAALPHTKPYLMYGLTEAFRSTYLHPEEIDKRPDSMGKAIPNAEIMVVREDGSHCAPGEPGELVHRGSLVAMGYWNDEEKTAERFKPTPGQTSGIPITEIVVWSGDTVRMDEEGFLYFISRKDEMIKTSGYRVSPTEIEEVIYQAGLVGEVAALGVQHPTLGQAILAIVTPNKEADLDTDQLLSECKKHLPGFMVPSAIIEQPTLARNPNGKIDRKLLAEKYKNQFQES